MINWLIVSQIAGPILAAVLGIGLGRWWERRPRIIAYLMHATGCRVAPAGQPPFVVNVHTVALRNDGARAATNLRLGHRPVNFSYTVSPEVNYVENTLNDGAREIVFPTFPPKRLVTVTYLYVGLTWPDINTHLESDEGPATVHNVFPTRRFSRPVAQLLGVVFFCGLIALAYALFELVAFVWRLSN